MDALLEGMNAISNGGESGQSLMHAPEAERIIEQLAPMTVQDVGTAKWTAQGQDIQRLNLQAHYNAQKHAEEFVVELLVSLDKMQILVQNLLAIEAWKEKALPHLHRHLARNVDKVVSYMVLYYEVTLANLLEVTLYHGHAAEALSEEYLLELADWCYRKLTYLNAPQGGRRVAAYKELSAKELMEMSPEQELDAKVDETDFAAAMCCLSILRYLTDGLNTLPMGLLSRVVATNDTLMALVPLLDQPPWARRKPNGVFEKWMNNQWQAVEAADRFRLCQADAQVWLAITNLVVEPKSRAKYSMDEWRRDRLLTLKRFMNELLFDQIPVLKDLQRVLDEMALGVGTDASSARNAALILEAVPVLRDSLLAVQDWRGLALSQAQAQFSPEATQKTARSMYQSLTQSFDFMADVMAELEGLGRPAQQAHGGAGSHGAPHGSGGGGAKRGGPGPVRLSSWRKVHESGVMEPWSDYVFELDPTKPPEPVALEHLQGLRYRLLPLDLEVTRPLPISGKAVVRCSEPEASGSAPPRAASSGVQGPATAPAPLGPGSAAGTLMAEALISLPEVALRSKAGEQPPVVWVTIGLLATDGLALQLKLKRADKPRERDKVLGVWCAYHPVGGALTVLRDRGNTAVEGLAAAQASSVPSSQPAGGVAAAAAAAAAGAAAAAEPAAGKPAERIAAGASEPAAPSAASAASRGDATSLPGASGQQGGGGPATAIDRRLQHGAAGSSAGDEQHQEQQEEADERRERSDARGVAALEVGSLKGQAASHTDGEEAEDGLDLPD